jgi:uncharacterized protein (TIGR02246 family)
MGPGALNMRERVKACYRQLLAAWNRRDADGFAALFTESGYVVGFDGSAMDGRAEIASTLVAVFLNQRIGPLAAKILDVRDVAPGVMLLSSVVGMAIPDDFDLNLSVNAVQSVVFVEQGDAVKVALLHSTPAAFHGRPEVADALMRELVDILRSQGPRH